ncbi:tetratricopeptide repeat protein [Pedobacter sp. GR22-10]|uniref:tetratricopeptide repeat-containing sensor histidine kinase n=1 Tax=Pedobacter sp. GR22-10 TaxID=2994472 RepID=UPI002245F169|nr:tetratricopeptide repeat protein [Pedobacter sp. GR22-10]MCX2429468.1 tetratricopeptide repeat protein [Pedobacter sp. GR22-10]
MKNIFVDVLYSCSKFWKQWLLLFLLIVLLFKLEGHAQKKSNIQKLDSLLVLNQSHSQLDSVKVKLLEQISKVYLGLKDAGKFEEYTNKTVALAQKLKLRNISGFALYRRGKFYHGKSIFIKSEEYYRQAIVEFELAKNLDMVGGTYLNLGALYATIPDYAKCLEVNQKAIAIYEQLGNESDLASCYTNISSVYQDLGNQSQSLVYLKMALKIFTRENEESRGVAVVNELIGTAYYEANPSELEKMGILPKDRLNIALQYYQKSLRVADLLNDENIMSSIRKSIADVYNEMGKKDLALITYQKAIQIGKNLDDKLGYVDCLYALGKFYQQQNDDANALAQFTESYKMADENNFTDQKKNAALGLSDTYYQLKDYNQSLNFYKQYVVLRDQIFNEDKEKEITRRQMQIDFDFKEKDYRYKQKITGIELQKQMLLARQQQQELYVKKQQLALSDQEKSLQRLTFLKRQLDLQIAQKNQTEKFERAKLQAKYETSLRDKQISKQEQQIRFDWRIKIYLSIGIALVLFIAAIIYYNQRKTARLNKVINLQTLELQQLNRVKDKIFSVVSHDMRTPVNALISFIQLLEGGAIDQDKLTRYAATLKTNLSYTSTMMENLLNWAASQMQGFHPDMETLNIHQLISGIIDAVLHHADAKNIKIENNTSPDIKFKADANMLSLIVRNLVSNAVKFTPRYGMISISVKSSDDEVYLRIADNGTGLSDHQLEHFNKTGYQGAGISTPGTEKEKGTGLGLILCRTFTELMGGKISAAKNNPAGTIFTITMPK